MRIGVFVLIQGRRTEVKPKTPAIIPTRAGWRIPAWAQQIGCSRSTVYNLAKAGEIELVRVGGMSIVRTDPDAYLAAKAAEQRTA